MLGFVDAVAHHIEADIGKDDSDTLPGHFPTLDKVIEIGCRQDHADLLKGTLESGCPLRRIGWDILRRRGRMMKGSLLLLVPLGKARLTPLGELPGRVGLLALQMTLLFLLAQRELFTAAHTDASFHNEPPLKDECI